MALKFGELWGDLKVDDSQIKPGVARAVDKGNREMDGLEAHAEKVGKQSGEKVADGMGKGMDDLGGEMEGAVDGASPALMLGMAGLATAAGALFATAFANAMDVEKGNDRLAAQLGLNEEQSRIAGGVAGKLYSGAYGENMEEVNDAVGAVASTLTKVSDANADDLERLSVKALDLASAFGIDVGQAVNTVGTAVRVGLVKDADEGFDLVTASMQRMPAMMRDELFDKVEEYGVYLHDMGFTGAEAFGFLVEASKGGEIQMDKSADAIKELSIRGSDMSAASVAAYGAMGLSAEDMSAKIVTGGDSARGALDAILTGLLGIEDPTVRSNTAITLMGTQLEDLGVAGTPEFLQSLQATLANTSGSLEDTEGAADDLGTTLNENTATDAEAFKRSLSTMATDGINNLMVATQAFPDNTRAVWGEITRQWDEGSDSSGDAWGGMVRSMRNIWDDTGIDDIVTGTFNILKDTFVTTWHILVGIWHALTAALRGDWGEMWDGIKEAFGAAWDWIWRTLTRVWDGIKETIGGALGAVWALITNVFNWVVSFIGGLPGRIWGIARGMFTGITDFAQVAVESAIAWVGSLPGRLLGFVGTVGAAAGRIGSAIMDKIGEGISHVAGAIGDVAGQVWNAIKGFVNRSFIDPLRGFGVSVFGHDLRPFSGMPRLHSGGVVPGAFGSEVPAVLMAGETVRTVEQERGLQDAVAMLSGAAMTGMGAAGASMGGYGGQGGTGARGGSGGRQTTIGTMQVVTNDPPRRWLDEGLWRVAG